MIKITIRNVTFECKNDGQIIEVALLKNDWLHEGTIICPVCHMFCDNCDNIEDNSSTGPDITSSTDTPDDDLKEDLNDICSRDPGTNFFMEFAQALGLGNTELFS